MFKEITYALGFSTNNLCKKIFKTKPKKMEKANFILVTIYFQCIQIG